MSDASTLSAPLNDLSLSQATPVKHPTMTTAPLPAVDFGFDDLKDRMVRFTARFDEFIEKGRKRILEEKNEFAKNIAQDKDLQRSLKADIAERKEKEKQIAENDAKEEQEAVEAERAIGNMKSKQQSRADYNEQLQAQIAETRQAIERKRALRAAEKKHLSSQASRNTPELEFFVEHLGMRIEGAGIADHIRIVFSHIVDSDWGREFTFVLNMVNRDYEIVQCRPNVNRENMDRVLNKLNESRDFSAFLKDMRRLFQSEASAE